MKDANGSTSSFGSKLGLFGLVAVVLGIVALYSYKISPSRTIVVPSQSIRIFGPSNGYTEIIKESNLIHHEVFSEADRSAYVQAYGESCWTGLVQRYHKVSVEHQIQLWKYCVMYVGHGNVYQDDGISLFVDHEDLLKPAQTLVLKSSTGIYHSSFLQLHQRQIARQMSQYLVETNPKEVSTDRISSTLTRLMRPVVKVEHSSHCRDLKDAHSSVESCPSKGGYCCQIVNNDSQEVLGALRQPSGVTYADARDDDVEDVSSGFVSTITVHPTNAEPATPFETPNFFDILLQNDCLPTTKQCHKCLKKSDSCSSCLAECPCYCKALCNIQPPPKVVTQVWHVQPPTYKRDASRLIPRLVHQTWFEPVTKEQYPNMSRLIESWKASGWEYTFYDDASAAEFLSNHFPPPVRQAYDAILPGAFKADLFRYCVLLIKGGVYADMDVLLESHLDSVLEPDVGFMVPIDEPGSLVEHRSCLWNGLLAVAPGHPLIAQTIELVVNNIRNRFTSVDYDDMLCPRPTLSVSHTVDTLFTCGPCILGGAMNKVLGRHMQSQWELGDVDVWKVPSKGKDDPRHLIPGRTIILSQNKEDMGAHRFTWLERNIMVATTDMPDYDDRPPTKQHYSSTHEKVGVYGLRNLYKDNVKANEAIKIVVI